jgi:hypothetical protein
LPRAAREFLRSKRSSSSAAADCFSCASWMLGCCELKRVTCPTAHGDQALHSAGVWHKCFQPQRWPCFSLDDGRLSHLCHMQQTCYGLALEHLNCKPFRPR